MSVYGPVTWYKRAKQAFHADAGNNLPSGVTLSSIDSGVLESESGGTRTTVAGVTVGDRSVATGELSGKASSGVDYTLEATGTAPANGTNYYVVIVATRSDGTKEVLEQRLTVKS